MVAAAWVRRMRKTGTTTYSGMYGTATLPGSGQPSVRVVFPLPEGSLMVFLEPRADADGGLHLYSRQGRFGADGAYLVLEAGGDRFGHGGSRSSSTSTCTSTRTATCGPTTTCGCGTSQRYACTTGCAATPDRARAARRGPATGLRCVTPSG